MNIKSRNYSVAPPDTFRAALPRQLSRWLAALPAGEKARGFRSLPIHRAVAAFLESPPQVRAGILDALDPQSLRLLCRHVPTGELWQVLPLCRPHVAEFVRHVVRTARLAGEIPAPGEAVDRRPGGEDPPGGPMMPWALPRLVADVFSATGWWLR